MPLSRALLALALTLWGGTAFGHPGHPSPQGHLHVYAAPAGGSSQPALEMGACVGEGAPIPAPAKTPAYDVAKSSIPAAEWEYWKILGYKQDLKKGRLLSPEGAEVSVPEVEHLRGDFDAGRERMAAETWMFLSDQGVRLDENTCRLLDGAKNPVSRLVVAGFRFMMGKSQEQAAVEALRVALAAADPSKPVPPEIQEKLAQFKTSQLRLPADLEAKLAAAPSAKEALAAVDAAHLDLTRFFDGQIALGDRVKAAFPVAAWNAPKRIEAYAGEAEARLGAAFQTDLQAHFAKLGPGRELMDRFKGPDGKVHLPRIQILKLAQRPDDPGYGGALAVFNPASDSVIFNYWAVVRSAAASAPEKDRERLAKEFADPRKLTDYLEKNPDARAKFLAAQDMTLYHELVHAWQDRRTKLDVEMLRGNVAGVNPLEKEHEAFREQYRYFHAKLLADPAAAATDPEVQSYMFLLGSYDQFRDAVTGQYMRNIGGSSDAPTLAEIQKGRRSLAQRLSRSGPAGERFVQLMKLMGLSWGDEALSEFKKDQDARTKEFVEKEWPKMRKEGFAALTAEFRKQGRPDKALMVALSSMGGVPEADRLAARKDTEAALKAGRMSFNVRIEAWQALDHAYNVEKKPLPEELQAQRQADYKELVRRWIGAARAAKTPAEKKAALEWARQYLGSVEDREALRREIQELEKSK